MTYLHHDYPEIGERPLDPPDDPPESIEHALRERAEDEMSENDRVFADWLYDQHQDMNPLALEITRAALYANKWPNDENCSIALRNATESLQKEWIEYRMRTFDYWDRASIARGDL